MDGRITFLKEHRLLWALCLSGLLHLLLLLFYSRWGWVRLFQLPETLRESAVEEERMLSFEIIETPDESRSDIPPEQAEYLSDKYALAQDMMENFFEDIGLPYSELNPGADIVPEHPEIWNDEQFYQNRSQDDMLPDIDGEAFTYQESSQKALFSREFLLSPERESRSTLPQNYQQQKFSARDMGGISFNTYEWNFAPYLIELKRRIQRNIYPPPVFTRLGYGGFNVIHFQILPNGYLEALQVLTFQGEQALVQTSQKAVEVSAPFWPLPDDFPEEFLEVKATFHYIGIDR